MPLLQKRRTRAQQPSTLGLGQMFISPRKRFDKHKSKTFVVPIGQDAKRRRLAAQLQALLEETDDEKDNMPDVILEEPVAFEMWNDNPLPPSPQPLPRTVPDTTPKPRRILPDETAHKLYKKWDKELFKLVDPLLAYISRSCGKVVHPTTALETTCLEPLCMRKTGVILCLFQNCMSLNKHLNYELIVSRFSENLNRVVCMSGPVICPYLQWALPNLPHIPAHGRFNFSSRVL
jgi:hypothetical protein